jgi:excisionase family DNA binding protein
MTVHEVAEILEIAPSLVYRLCRAGRMPHRRIGLGRGAIRITEADLAEFLEAARVGIRAEEEMPKPEPARRTKRVAGGPRPKWDHF